MEFNDSYGMRYAPEDDEPIEPEIYYCNDCGCSLTEEEAMEGDDGEMYCLECTEIYNKKENEKDNN